MDHEENKKTFLEELQSLEETTKRKVVVVSTIILMVGVIYLWLGYFNTLVVGQSQRNQVAQNNDTAGTMGVTDGATGAQVAGTQNNAANATTGANFFQNMKNGMAWIAGMFKSPGQYNIQPSR
jgi:hypothetical protein